MINQRIIIWDFDGDENTPPSPMNHLLQENGDRILQENGGAILIDTPVIIQILQENSGQILQENGGLIYSG